jgi:hypothetical protein
VKKNLLLVFLICYHSLFAQDGTIIEKNSFPLHDTIIQYLQQRDAALAKRITDSVSFYRITYLSDGIKVTYY